MEINRIRFKNPDTGEEIVFDYRDPEPDEWIKYSARITAIYSVDNEDKEVKLEKILKTQFEMGSPLIEGFSGSSGIFKNLTIENPDWKEILKKKATQLIILFAQEIFERKNFDIEKNF